MSTCRILAMDGGGIHGLLIALLLKRIENGWPGFLGQVDIFAGTSAGGIMALMMASEEDPEAALADCINLWVRQKVFTNTPVGNGLAVLGQGAFFSNDNLRRAMNRYFDDRTMESLKKRVVIPTFQMDNQSKLPGQRSWQPMIFHNFGKDFDTRIDTSTVGERLADVALRTSAGPLDFPVYQGYVDGGLYANNPSMAAVALSLDRSGARDSKSSPLPQSLDEISIISIGNGHSRHYDRVGSESWGWARWLLDPQHPLRLLDAVTEAGEEMADYLCRTILKPEQYFRLDPILKAPVSYIDDGRSIPMLHEVAFETDLGLTYDWIEKSNWFDDDAPAMQDAAADRRSRRRRTRSGATETKSGDKAE